MISLAVTVPTPLPSAALLIPIGILALFIVIACLMPYLSGWSAAARWWRTNRLPWSGGARVQLIEIDWGMAYHRGFQIRLLAEGVHIQPILWQPLLRFHRPLLIPWDAITEAKPHHDWWGAGIEIRAAVGDTFLRAIYPAELGIPTELRRSKK